VVVEVKVELISIPSAVVVEVLEAIELAQTHLYRLQLITRSQSAAVAHLIQVTAETAYSLR
jgi:hypothetical protein